MARPSLMAVYKAIQEQLLTFVAAAGNTLPSFGIGAKDVFNHNQKPRISWQPLGGPVGPPHTAGGDSKSNPRPLFARRFSTAAYVWCESIDATNELAHHLVAALYAVATNQMKVTSEKWEISGDLDQGIVMFLIFEVVIPFVDETSPSVTLGSAPVTGAFATG